MHDHNWTACLIHPHPLGVQLTEEMERYRELERVLRATQESWEQRMSAEEEQHAAEMEVLQEEADSQLDDKRAERQQCVYRVIPITCTFAIWLSVFSCVFGVLAVVGVLLGVVGYWLRYR